MASHGEQNCSASDAMMQRSVSDAAISTHDVERHEDQEGSLSTTELFQRLAGKTRAENLKVNGAHALRAHFLDTLYAGREPFDLVRANRNFKSDWSYGGTKITEDFIDIVLSVVKPSFWLEIGSMIGGSAVKVANRVKRKSMDTFILCMDPWSGDVNMWAWQEDALKANEFDSLYMDEYGHPRIYETFLANVVNASHDDIILPVTVSSMVGIRLLSRLEQEKRLPVVGGKQHLPEVIYLDSAHEKDETLMEIGAAYEILPPGGVLMGDDWGWDSVRGDVQTFARNMSWAEIPAEQVKKYDLPDATAKQPVNGLIVVGCAVPVNALEYCKTKGQWLLFK